MRSKVLLLLWGSIFIAAAAHAQSGPQYTGTYQGPAQYTTGNSNNEAASYGSGAGNAKLGLLLNASASRDLYRISQLRLAFHRCLLWRHGER
jgi:hypothetical protein